MPSKKYSVSKENITSLLQRPSVRYVLVGGSVYVLELVVIVVAQHLGQSSTVAVGLSFWIGLIVSFLLQKIFTFKDKRTRRGILLPQVIGVTLLVLFNFGFTILLTKLLIHTMPAVVTRTLAICITTLWNFYLYRTRIFKTGTPEIDEDITY